MSYKEITKCRGCHSLDLRSILDLGNQYIVNFVDDPKEQADSSPIHLVACANCRLVQLRHSVNPDRLFKQFFYYSGVNTTMRGHLAALVQQAREIEPVDAGDYVVSIGENDGWMLSNFPRNVNTIGIEPAVNMMSMLKKNCTLAINDYFNDAVVTHLKSTMHIKAKHIYAIAMFYDIDNPENFLDNVKQILHDDGIFVIQMNYLKTMMENVAVDNICTEHVTYYTLQSLEPILTRSKLKVFHVSLNELNGGSIRIYVCHENADRMTYFNYMQMVVDENKWFGPPSESKLIPKLEFFSKRVSDGREKLQKFIKDAILNHQTIYAYGASTRGASLLQVMGLKYPLIQKAVERNPIKFGKWMAGLNIEIISEEEMHKTPPDYLLILPYWFLPEFINREQQFLINGGRFILPLPNPYLYENGGKVTLL